MLFQILCNLRPFNQGSLCSKQILPNTQVEDGWMQIMILMIMFDADFHQNLDDNYDDDDDDDDQHHHHHQH